MFKYWLQVKSNIKKTKSISFTLVIMFVISALLLNSGLLISSKYGNFYNELKEELNTSNAYYLISDSLYNETVENSLKNNKHIDESQVNEMLILNTDIYSKEIKKEKQFQILFQDMDEKRELSKWKFVGETDLEEKDTSKDKEMPVYLPDVMKSISGYELNDKIELKYKDVETMEENKLVFRVSGYIEDIYFSSTDTGFMGFYLSKDNYQELQKTLNHIDYKVQVVFANVDDVKNVAAIQSELLEITDINSGSFFAMDNANIIFSIDIALVDMSRTMMAAILSVMMVIFSVIIVIVCLLVVRFRIINTVEEDLGKIGSLKSIGYTSKQIRMSIVLQFLILAIIGSFLGIILSYFALPSIALVFERQSGLLWEQGVDVVISIITIAILFVFVLVTSYLATKRINKLTPIMALRGESQTKRLKRNHRELEKTRGPITTILAQKSIFQNIKQTIMILVIIVAVTFAGAFGVVMFYNTTIDTTAFAEVPGMEITNAIAITNPTKDNTQMIESIKKMDGVDRVLYFDEVKVKVDETEVVSFVMNDYKDKETQLVYEGRYPNKNNEITLAGVVADRINKKVGDTVTIQVKDKKEKLKVVGLSNGSSMGGQNVSLRTEDVKRLNKDFKEQSLYIYLNKDVNTEKFVKTLNKQYEKELMTSVINFDKGLAEGMASYQSIMKMMGVVMFVITLIVITLILYFMISSTVIKKKKELGIQKAIGYTTFQLMTQFSLEFLIPVLIGGIIGSLLGALGCNPMMSIAMRSAGIMKANFIVNPVWVILFGISMIVFSYLLSLIITWRIRKISAYKLVTE